MCVVLDGHFQRAFVPVPGALGTHAAGQMLRYAATHVALPCEGDELHYADPACLPTGPQGNERVGELGVFAAEESAPTARADWPATPNLSRVDLEAFDGIVGP